MRFHVRDMLNNVLGQTMPGVDNSNLGACQMLQKYTVVQIVLIDARPTSA